MSFQPSSFSEQVDVAAHVTEAEPAVSLTAAGKLPGGGLSPLSKRSGRGDGERPVSDVGDGVGPTDSSSEPPEAVRTGGRYLPAAAGPAAAPKGWLVCKSSRKIEVVQGELPRPPAGWCAPCSQLCTDPCALSSLRERGPPPLSVGPPSVRLVGGGAPGGAPKPPLIPLSGKAHAPPWAPASRSGARGVAAVSP